MDERGVREADLRHALGAARSCTPQKTGSWRVDGADLDGDDLTMIVVIEDGLLVVTLF